MMTNALDLKSLRVDKRPGGTLFPMGELKYAANTGFPLEAVFHADGDEGGWGGHLQKKTTCNLVEWWSLF